MSHSSFDKNGIDKSGTHWLQYAAFVVNAFAIYFGWAFFNDANFHHFAVKIFKFWNCNGYNPLSYCVMRWKVDFYPQFPMGIGPGMTPLIDVTKIKYYQFPLDRDRGLILKGCLNVMGTNKIRLIDITNVY